MEKIIDISFAITVCNEDKELDRLLNHLLENKYDNDEIVIVTDEANITKDVINVINKYQTECRHCIKVCSHNLNNDFAQYKNYLNSHCNRDYIFQIDADEHPSPTLIDNIHSILESNDIDLYHVPRVNTVEGLTQEHINKWRWDVNEKGWVNWPDPQTRLYRNNKDIKWVGKVHERIVGHKTETRLPYEEEYALYHPKDIKRQEKQNEYYNTIQ